MKVKGSLVIACSIGAHRANFLPIQAERNFYQSAVKGTFAFSTQKK